MLELHPQFLTQNGQKQFAVLPYEEFLQIMELLENWEDLRDLQVAKEAGKDSISMSLSELKKMLVDGE